jgi:spore maturation protein CgeB
MRLFEACGVGTCQLTDYREEVVHAFEPDTEVVIYRSIDECIEKARWLLEHPAERRKIGLAGQTRALREHTVSRRAEQIHAHLLQLLSSVQSRQHLPANRLAQTT